MAAAAAAARRSRPAIRGLRPRWTTTDRSGCCWSKTTWRTSIWRASGSRAHGEQALRAVGQAGKPIDLVITDLIMPQMTGAELVERLDVSDPHLSVLFTTGLPRRGRREDIA
jgi:hypothetical protein